jgi:hypothetical protein
MMALRTYVFPLVSILDIVCDSSKLDLSTSLPLSHYHITFHSGCDIVGSYACGEGIEG